MHFSVPKFTLVIIAMFLFLGVSGCATMDRRVDILYQPVANVKGGSGDLYVVRAKQAVAGSAADVQWVLGGVTDSDGEKLGNIVTDMAPEALVFDALTRELTAAGFNVIAVDAMPLAVKKGLQLTGATIKLDDTHSLIKDEVHCAMKMSVQVWQEGKAVTAQEYQTPYADTAVRDRDTFLTTSLQKSLQLLMSQSTPDIFRTIERPR